GDALAAETRFTPAELLREHGIVSGMTVIIQGHKQPYGVLGVHATECRMFSRDDVHFVQAVANVLAMAVERDRAEGDRAGLLAAEQRARAEAERLAEVGRLITESLDLGEGAQRIADSVLEFLGVDGATVLRLG